MKFKYVLYALSLFLLLACQNNPTYLVIKGQAPIEKNGDSVMLFKFKADTIFDVDTTTIKNGVFEFKGEEYLNDLAIITSGNFPHKVNSVELVLERGEMQVMLDSISTVKGTPLNEVYNAYKRKLLLYDDSLKILQMEKSELLDSMRTKKYSYQYEWIKNNLTNPLGRSVLRNGQGYLKSNDWMALYDLTPVLFKSDPYLKTSYDHYKKGEEIRIKREKSIGKKFTDFELMTPEGTVKKLSDYVGKSEFLYIEFTASWCSPCRAEIPMIKKAYEKHKDKGLKIISISLDTNVDRWKRFIQEENIFWTNLSDLQGRFSALTEAYCINGIPHGILLNKEGVILYSPLPGELLYLGMDMIIEQQKSEKQGSRKRS